MADFPRDWNDGEHLLPSDIFITEPPLKHDLLAHRLSALALLNQRQSFSSLKTTHNFQRFGGQENPTCQSCFKSIPKPVQPSQVDVFLAMERRVIQKQMYQNHLREKLSRNRALQNRLGGGGGTGVFHPRVLNENTHFTPPTINTYTPFVKNRQVTSLNRSEIQNPSHQRNCVATTTNTASFGRYQIPSEMFLPKDWTY